jgi:PhoH-like ATPase
MKKTFVLDTNVILHDYDAIYNFEDNDVVIPIVVLEELDKFKKGNGIINFNARKIMRELDKLSEKYDVFADGITLGNDKGKLFVKTIHHFDEEFQATFSDKEYADNKILFVARNLQKSLDEEVVLITQDVNLRLKARSIGVKAQDYKTGKVVDIERINKQPNTYQNFDTELINKLYQQGSLPVHQCNFNTEPLANEYFMLSDGNSTAVVTYDETKKIVRIVKKQTAYHIKPRNSEQTFALDALMRKDIELVSLTGRAGTGKTLLALAAALAQANDYYQIMLARPIVALSDKDLGYLPGSAEEKVRPYMQPLFDNLNVIKQSAGFTSKDAQKIDDMLQEKKLLIEPLAYIRGRSLPNAFFIIDEAQNLTPHEVKTIITRAGEGTKIIFTGDIDQIDSPYLDERSNGLSYLTDKMKGQKIFAHVNLVKGERSQLAELASKLL